MATDIPFVLYSSDGWEEDKVIGIVKSYNKTFCQVYLFSKYSEIVKEVDENGNIVSFGIIGAKK